MTIKKESGVASGDSPRRDQHSSAGTSVYRFTGIHLTAHDVASCYQTLPESAQPIAQNRREADFYQMTGMVYAPDNPRLKQHHVPAAYRH